MGGISSESVRHLPSIGNDYTPLETHGFGTVSKLLMSDGTMIAEQTGLEDDKVYKLQGEAMDYVAKNISK